MYLLGVIPDLWKEQVLQLKKFICSLVQDLQKEKAERHFLHKENNSHHGTCEAACAVPVQVQDRPPEL